LFRAEPAVQVRAGRGRADDLEWNLSVFHVALSEVSVADERMSGVNTLPAIIRAARSMHQPFQGTFILFVGQKENTPARGVSVGAGQAGRVMPA